MAQPNGDSEHAKLLKQRNRIPKQRLKFWHHAWDIHINIAQQANQHKDLLYFSVWRQQISFTMIDRKNAKIKQHFKVIKGQSCADEFEQHMKTNKTSAQWETCRAYCKIKKGGTK